MSCISGASGVQRAVDVANRFDVGHQQFPAAIAQGAEGQHPAHAEPATQNKSPRLCRRERSGSCSVLLFAGTSGGRVLIRAVFQAFQMDVGFAVQFRRDLPHFAQGIGGGNFVTGLYFRIRQAAVAPHKTCLLYTSDAADEL